MMRFFTAIIGGFVGIGLSILIFYVIGYLFGPLSQGEDDAAKYFKIFLGVAFVLFIVSGLAASKLYKHLVKKKS
jgi:ABC-type antimicrobial peptide transport system permease subunit